MKNDFTRTMRNVAASDRNESGRYHGGTGRNDRIHTEVQIEPSDKVRLEFFTKQETAMYNGLVEAFSPRTRAFPETLLNLTDAEEKLYGAIATLGRPITPLLRSSSREALPESLKEFENLIFGKEGKTGPMTFAKASIVDMGSIPAKLLPEVRRNMAVEFLEHYRAQAKKITTPATGSDDSLYKEPPEFLVEMTSQQKRHLQIPRKSLQMKWDDEKRETLVVFPYIASPMIVKDMNLIEQAGWNYMVLHQDHVKNLNPMTPWVIDLRRVNSKYLLKTVDSSGNMRSKIFNEAKRRSF